MVSNSMSPVQRVMLIAAVSMLFPSIILIGWLFREISLQQMESIEANSQQAADLIVLLADTRAEADLTALRVLSTAQYFAAKDFVGAAKRAEGVLNLIPGWKAVILAEAVTGKVYFTATSTEVTVGDKDPFTSTENSQKNGFGGVEREGRWCPCVRLQMPVRDLPNLVLTALIDPGIYQSLIMDNLPKGAVVAFVDQSGDFIARSLDFDGRVGTPATEFVRNAIIRGGRGIYKGRTYEGLTNFSAYTVSGTTGWSSHVAINEALLARPRAIANRFLIFGALAAIATGTLLFTFLARDIASRRLEDRRLMELQKAEAVREFTATVIHDFRNILAAVQSGLNLIIRNTKEPQTEKRAVMIGEVMERGTRLTNRLLSFVREDSHEICDIEIGAFLRNMDYLLQQAAGPRTQIKITFPATAVTLTANRDQLELALVNLVVNARDAMNGVGKIDIGVVVDERHVGICVEDTGPGIPIEMRQQVFERFFTTKPDGSGTGLGLSQVAEMVREANGKVTVEAANGGGAKFVIQFNRSVLELKQDKTTMAG